MMNDGVAKLACRERLRSRDMKGTNKEEKGEMHYYEEEEEDDEEEEDEEGEKMRDGVKKVKSRKASIAILEKENGRRVAINLSDDDEKEDAKRLDKNVKNKDEKRMHAGSDKMKYRKVPATTFDKQNNKKIVSSHGREKKVHSGDHDKDKRRGMLLPLDKNKDPLKEKSRKTWNTHSAGKKIHSCDHCKDKRTCVYSKSKQFENEKRKNMSSHNGENKIRSYDYGEHKGWSQSRPFNNNVMQKNEMKKKNTTLDLSNENKTQMRMDSKKENKRKKTPEIFNKSKKRRTEDKDEKAGSGDRWKTKKKTIEGYNKEQKVPSDHKEKGNVTIAFFKSIVNNNFEEFLLLPPVVASKLMYLSNRHVNLEDSEGKLSDVKLSMVEDSLAFHQGWNDFVSDHSIKLGDFLLFEYTARSQFSVRVFGMDSCERVCFGVERQGGKKQKGCHAPDEMENAAKSVNAVSGARRVSVNSKDHNEVVSWVEHGSSIALYDKDGCLANGKHKANDIFQTWSKGTKKSGIILITDDEAPLTQEIEDTEKLKTLHAASEAHCVSDNIKEDPKGVAIGALCGPSVALDNREGTLAGGECKINCISSIFSTEKTTRTEIIPVIDEAPLAQENENAVELTTCPLHIEDTSTMKESEPEIATAATCTEIQDSDEDLRRKQEGNTVQLECNTAVDKCPNNSKMSTNGDVCSKHEAPGGSPSLEKWKKATVSGLAAFDGTGLIKPENVMKTEDRLLGNCSLMEVNSFEQRLQGYGTEPIRPEKRLKTDDKLVGNSSATGVSPVEQSLRGYAGTHSCVQQTPGKISKFIHIKAAMDLSVNGKDHHFFSQEDKKASHHVTPAALLPVKVEVLELDDHSVLKTNLQFCIPSTTQTCLELPTSLSNALGRKGRQDRNVVMLKDPMKRLWPVFYHENSLFVGFTRGWKPFVAANKLQTGDVCLLLKDLDEDELVYHVQFTRK